MFGKGSVTHGATLCPGSCVFLLSRTSTELPGLSAGQNTNLAHDFPSPVSLQALFKYAGHVCIRVTSDTINKTNYLRLQERIC